MEDNSVTADELPGLQRIVYATAALFFIALISSSLLFLYYSSAKSDDRAAQTAQSFVQLEVSHQLQMARRDQSQVSNWTKASLAFRDRADQSFAKNELANWFFEVFGILSSTVVDMHRNIFADVMGEVVLEPGNRQSLVDQNADLIDTALARFKSHQKKLNGGYVVVEASQIPELLAVSAYRKIAGQLRIVTAQVIVSDDAISPVNDGSLRILLAVKAVNQKSISGLSQKIGLPDLQITPIASNSINSYTVMLPNLSRPSEYMITWVPLGSFFVILKTEMPIFVTLFLIVGVCVGFAGYRYGAIIHRLEVSEKSNRFLANHDLLTSLPNRGAFDARVSELLKQEPAGDGFAVLSVDLDRFKAVNDTFGHHAGDIVIQEIASRLTKLIGNAGMVARMGGDEFTCLITSNADQDTIAWLCETIIELISNPVEIPGGSAKVGASIGVAFWPESGSTLRAIMRKADTSLYASKNSGKGRFHFSEQKNIRHTHSTAA